MAKTLEQCTCEEHVEGLKIKNIAIAVNDTELFIRGDYEAITVEDGEIELSILFKAIQDARDKYQKDKAKYN
jgi:pyrimidine deaminase RibD-like protein